MIQSDKNVKNWYNIYWKDCKCGRGEERTVTTGAGVIEEEAEKQSDGEEERGSQGGGGERHVVNRHSLYHPWAVLVLVMRGSHFDVQPSLFAVICESGTF